VCSKLVAAVSGSNLHESRFVGAYSPVVYLLSSSRVVIVVKVVGVGVE